MASGAAVGEMGASGSGNANANAEDGLLWDPMWLMPGERHDSVVAVLLACSRDFTGEGGYGLMGFVGVGCQVC